VKKIMLPVHLVLVLVLSCPALAETAMNKQIEDFPRQSAALRGNCVHHLASFDSRAGAGSREDKTALVSLSSLVNDAIDAMMGLEDCLAALSPACPGYFRADSRSSSKIIRT
jgi:hypothetical protein